MILQQTIRQKHLLPSKFSHKIQIENLKTGCNQVKRPVTVFSPASVFQSAPNRIENQLQAGNEKSEFIECCPLTQ